MIKRKPVPQPSWSNIEQRQAQACISEVVISSPIYRSDPPPYNSADESSLLDYYLDSVEEVPPTHSDHQGPLKKSDLGQPARHVDVEDPSKPPPSNSQATLLDAKSTKVKHALESALSEAKHFAGGLLSHPHESTKHYTILRHSFGLIYYRGPTTNISITIFSDHPLPDDRTMWLQKRGFSGKTGLAIGAALNARSAWINVTPIAQTSSDQLPKDQERAWQRDISSFRRKAHDIKHICRHTPRETNLIRIPYAAEDGYFRVVLCSGRKILCPSPTFRYASTSMDPGMLRGASLLTLPLEVGLKVGARVATTAANAATHHALRPATAVVQTASKQVDWGPIPWLGVRGGSNAFQDPMKEEKGFSVKR